MALALVGLILGSAILLACLLIVADRMARQRRASASACHPHVSHTEASWIPAYGDGGSDCSAADAGAGCDGGGGD